MSLLWKTAVEASDSAIQIQTGDAWPRPNGYTYKARVPADHPMYRPEHGSLAGYAHVESVPDQSDPGSYKTHIHMIEVNPGYAGQGVGKALLEHVVRNAEWGGVSHDGFTPSGAHLWRSVTGEEVQPDKKADQPRHRDWRYAT